MDLAVGVLSEFDASTLALQLTVKSRNDTKSIVILLKFFIYFSFLILMFESKTKFALFSSKIG